MKKNRKPAKRHGGTRARRLSLWTGVALACAYLLYAAAGVWFVHQPREWTDSQDPTLARALLYVGNSAGDLTDALGWTGHDAVYEYDQKAPNGSVLFAGAPLRTGPRAPGDVVVLDRGHFKVGWSPSLHHPLWCAYHVVKDPRHTADRRPSFVRDSEAVGSPSPGSYARTGYDRGHMAPNYAIATRYGEAAQKLTFRMSNVIPQRPSLNRGVWRDVERRIADLWTARYGEIWVIVGCIGDEKSGEKLSGTSVSVPQKFYQLIVAQDGLDVRALALVFDQDTPWDEYAARHLVTIDELEAMTDLDFLPDLPAFIQDPLEADRPTRLWPIRPVDILRLVILRYKR